MQDVDRRRPSAIRWVVTLLMALIPIASLGLLAPAPSLVLAARHRNQADWAVFGAFTLAWLMWIAALIAWPDGGTGVEFAATALLLALTTGGAAMHYLLSSIHRSTHPRP